MRIISGKFKGKVIHAPKGLPVRPTTDRTKEALFNILSNRYEWEGMRVLDLFAGTGNMTYEFWSRGVESVLSVDQHIGCVKTIQRGLKELGVPGKVVKADVRKFIRQHSGSYDLIFMDPPYAMPGQDQIIQQIMEGKLLAAQGDLWVEHASQNSFDHLPGFVELRKYGSSSVSLFEAE
ncbi:16S rRNA (guanine(966)-N(2))-methyltransferase RsmD [Pontibacter sp. G13]|uniref:16S rRNA (guanine(966)-N(2))-methyltransferase RsmD n=1 Tax=Pontibacter sp. G13 TaxID=3074898 RepID=UPI0028899000|nr:16S rRNA (guanine(966)-N(2))-methyltransferase RsmD [Pontibacter sp. G13]WNJ20929.1 16S rRNA (guanine(966)-N(2))-methyltransferase RsmD [Pontibacter sp. G13]